MLHKGTHSAQIFKTLSCLGFFMILANLELFIINFIYGYLVTHDGYSSAQDFITDFSSIETVTIWVFRVTYFSFFLGAFYMLLNKKLFVGIVISFLFVELFSLYILYFPDKFQFRFTPEEYNPSLYLLDVILCLGEFAIWLILSLKSTSTLFRHGCTIYAIDEAVRLGCILFIGIIFSLDSTYYGDKFPTFFELRENYFAYISPLLRITMMAVCTIGCYKRANTIISNETSVK